MIISHKYKFIFVKTTKTAGSSMEALLETYLQPGDMMTLRGEIRKNKSAIKLLKDRGIEIISRKDMFTSHSPLITAHTAFPHTKQYFSFGILRDPFKRAISSFRWNKNNQIKRIQELDYPRKKLNQILQRKFLRYLTSGNHGLNTYGRNLLQSISANGQPWSVSRIHRLEDLDELERDLAANTGLKINCDSMPRLKSDTVPIPEHVNLFSMQAVKWISMQHQWELETMGYQIPAVADDKSTKAGRQEL